MRRATGITLTAAVLGLGVAACDVEETPETTDEAVEQPTLTPAPGAEPGQSGPALGVDTLQGAGAYLTDGDGRALYMIEGAPADSVTCYDECAREWPPFLAAPGTASADDPSVQANLIGTIERRDGQRQVTYAGHALYYYHDDVEPGQTSGQDLTDEWGEWYLVTPNGRHLEQGGS